MYCILIYIYIYIYIYTYIYVHIYIYIYVYIHMYIYIYYVLHVQTARAWRPEIRLGRSRDGWEVDRLANRRGSWGLKRV